MQQFHFYIQVPVWLPAFVVKLHNIFKSFQTAIVHVGSCVGDLAQRRRLECAPVLRIVRDGEAADVGVGLVGADSEVGVGVAGEIHAFMTSVASGFVEEDFHAMHLGGRHGILLASLIAVIG